VITERLDAHVVALALLSVPNRDGSGLLVIADDERVGHVVVVSLLNLLADRPRAVLDIDAEVAEVAILELFGVAQVVVADREMRTCSGASHVGNLPSKCSMNTMKDYS
jgi:hypothetical protein